MLVESTGVPYPVHVPPGPQSEGHRRMTRFVENMRTSVWGYDPSKVRLPVLSNRLRCCCLLGIIVSFTYYKVL